MLVHDANFFIIFCCTRMNINQSSINCVFLVEHLRLRMDIRQFILMLDDRLYYIVNNILIHTSCTHQVITCTNYNRIIVYSRISTARNGGFKEERVFSNDLINMFLIQRNKLDSLGRCQVRNRRTGIWCDMYSEICISIINCITDILQCCLCDLYIVRCQSISFQLNRHIILRHCTLTYC